MGRESRREQHPRYVNYLLSALSISSLRGSNHSPTIVILGQRVTQRYFRGQGYMEVDIEVGSSLIAAQIVGVCRNYVKDLTVDLGIVLQGEKESELPERLIGCLRLEGLDVNVRTVVR